jgi:hypothetical protein
MQAAVALKELHLEEMMAPAPQCIPATPLQLFFSVHAPAEASAKVRANMNGTSSGSKPLKHLSNPSWTPPGNRNLVLEPNNLEIP